MIAIRPLQRLTLVLGLLIPALCAADDAGLRGCRTLAEPAARLACYDALPLGVSSARAAPAVPARQAPETFGMEQQAASQNRLEEIRSHIPGAFNGWTSDTTVVLANGQSWKITDGSSRRTFLDNPKVTVRRAALGSFTLEIEGESRAPKVRRVQ